MHKKNTMIRITIGICLILFLLTLPWLKLRKSYVVIESPVDAAMTEEGEFRIVDKGGARVLFTDPSLRVQRIFESEESGDLRELVYIPHEDANLWVYRAILSSDSTTAYYCFHDGTIYSYDVKRKTEEKIYDGSSFQQPESIPKELTLSRDETLYFADIGFRDIGSIKEGQTSFLFGHRELDKEEFLQQESFEAIDAEQKLLGCSRYGVYFPIGGELTCVSKLELSRIATIGAMVSKISLSVICLAVKVVGLAEVGVYARQFEEGMDKVMGELLTSIMVIAAATIFLIVQLFRLAEYQGNEDD